MRFEYNYDPKADAISIDVGKRKSDLTLEITENILVDVTKEGKLAGIEILNTSKRKRNL